MTITWTKTAGQLAVMAAQRVQMLGDAQSLTGHRWVVWMDHLNDLLKQLPTHGPNEWRKAEQTIVAPTLAAGTATYTLNPRPFKVHSIIYWRDATGRDMPVQRWNQDQYRNLPFKTTQGHPSCFIVDRQRTATTITLWRVPDATIAAGSLIIPYDRVLEDVTLPGDIVDVPQEWLGEIADITGVRLADSFNLTNATIEKVRQRADAAAAWLLGEDNDESLIFVQE